MSYEITSRLFRFIGLFTIYSVVQGLKTKGIAFLLQMVDARTMQ